MLQISTGELPALWDWRDVLLGSIITVAPGVGPTLQQYNVMVDSSRIFPHCRFTHAPSQGQHRPTMVTSPANVLPTRSPTAIFLARGRQNLGTPDLASSYARIAPYLHGDQPQSLLSFERKIS